jgi:hypothetical protein
MVIFLFFGAAMGAKKTSRMERVPSRLLRVIRGARMVNASWMKIKFPLLKLINFSRQAGDRTIYLY